MSTADTNALQQCENEPLANSGLIQPNGVLLYIDKNSSEIRYASENAASLLGEGPDELLGLDGKDWLEQNLAGLVSWPASAGRRMHFPAGVDMGFGDLDVLISGTSGGWIVEFEASQHSAVDLAGIRLVRGAGRLDAAGLQALRQSLVDSVAKATGYDRVMLYQFDPDWSGDVLAEAVDAGRGSYLGLRFPASDIPAIARNLYAQTPYRHIPDSAAAPVAIKSRAGTGTALDLTWSDLRSVSPVHMQYLSNMHVLSSFSTSIMVDGKLWGLFACHHYAPQRLTFERRSVTELFSQMFSMRLESRERQLTVEFERRARDISDQLLGAVASDETLLRDPDWLADVLTRAIPAETPRCACGPGTTRPWGQGRPVSERACPRHSCGTSRRISRC